ncbi:hypothetical protein CSW23_02635, partial [Thermus scotoductus]
MGRGHSHPPWTIQKRARTPGLIPFLVVFFVHDRGRPPDPERAVAEGQEGQGPDREAPLSGRLP